jgi:hypothetical protein
VRMLLRMIFRELDVIRVVCHFQVAGVIQEFIQDMFSFVNMLAAVTLDNGAQFLSIHLYHHTAGVNA